jgi:hypothetical protein
MFAGECTMARLDTKMLRLSCTGLFTYSYPPSSSLHPRLLAHRTTFPPLCVYVGWNAERTIRMIPV